MRTVQQRTQAYNARMVSSVIDPVLSAVNAQQAANFQSYANEFVPKQEELRTIINDAGITGPAVFLLEAFNGEMYHCWKTYAGDSAIAEATILVAKYIAWGSLEATLIAIASSVYSITVPGGA